eukprot:TRINITY_DN2583_c0_g1_i1.p1 TRINITY_DN2583_c0_g1~~TRINITY_DN2583_c0_g1_i1.p1  ORF type:complete len:477 (+),score=95.86 TRINITY_DN2583_c0_g1_i1:67-1497(+)
MDDETFDDDETSVAILSGQSDTTAPLIPSSPSEAPTKRGVNALGLTMMIYFFTSGGPFGIEPSVGAAGPLLSLIAVIVVPLLWSLPQAILSAELSLMISENGGNVVWVQRAWGDLIGWVNAFNNLASSLSSMSLLVVLFVDYLPVDFTVAEEWALKLSFILVLTVINILGMRWISRASVFFLIIIVAPFFCMWIVFWVQGRLHWSNDALNYVPPMKEIKWGTFISTVVWSFGGFDSMGSMAGEVKGGRPTIMRGIIGSMPLVMVNYLFPLIIGILIAPDWQDWQSGYFTVVASRVTPWVHYFMVGSSVLSNFGQYNAAMAPLARVVWAMARAKGGAQKLPRILAKSHRRHTGTIRPIAAVIFVGVMSILGTALGYTILVQMFFVVRVVNLVCEYSALIRLRYTEPDTPRPFVTPAGKVGVWALGLPSAFLAAFTLYYTQWQAWAFGVGINAAIIAAYFLKLLIQKLWKRRSNRLVN